MSTQMTNRERPERPERTERNEGTERRSETLAGGQVMSPAVDIFENDQALLVVADLPGVRHDDLRIDLDKNNLTLEAKRNVAGAGEEARYVRWHRAFQLAEIFDYDKIDARLEAGVLRLTLPKSEAIKPRQIRVKAG